MNHVIKPKVHSFQNPGYSKTQISRTINSYTSFSLRKTLHIIMSFNFNFSFIPEFTAIFRTVNVCSHTIKLHYKVEMMTSYCSLTKRGGKNCWIITKVYPYFVLMRNLFKFWNNMVAFYFSLYAGKEEGSKGFNFLGIKNLK